MISRASVALPSSVAWRAAAAATRGWSWSRASTPRQRRSNPWGSACRLHALARRFGAPQPFVAPLEVAQLVRGARGEQGGEPRRRASVEGERGLLLGALVAALVVRLQRARERRVGTVAPAPRAECAHVRRQRERMAEEAQQRIERDERGDQAGREEQHRHFHAIRRIDEKHVPAVGAAHDDERHGRREHREQPEKRPHAARLIPACARGAT